MVYFGRAAVFSKSVERNGFAVGDGGIA